MATKLRLIHSDYCSYHYFEIVARKCSITFHDDVRSVEWAMTRTWGCLVAFLVSFRSRDASRSDDLPQMQTPDAPRSRIHTKFYYHTDKICRQRKIQNEEIEFNHQGSENLFKVSQGKLFHFRRNSVRSSQVHN